MLKQAKAIKKINLTLLNKLQIKLYISNLFNKFWALALKAIIYIYNRTPYSSLNFKIPYKVKFGIKPDLKNIKIQGSIVYNKILNNIKKLDPKAKLNMIINYGNNQYKLFDLKIKRVFYFRNYYILEKIFLNLLNPDFWNNYLRNKPFNN